MSLAQRFERRLEGLVGGAFARVFKGQVEPVEIGTALQREASDKRNVMGNSRVLCPNRYRVTLSPSDHDRLVPWEEQLTSSLAELLQEYLDDSRWETVGDIEVYLARDDALHTGVFGVASRMESAAPPRRRPHDSLSMPVVPGLDDDHGRHHDDRDGRGRPDDNHSGYPDDPSRYRPAGAGSPYPPPPAPAAAPFAIAPLPNAPAFPDRAGDRPYPPQPPPNGLPPATLLVDPSGQRYELRRGSNVVGRGSDSSLQLLDQGVSRRHVDVQFDGQVATAHDLGSTNGTTVNGHDVTSQLLRHGDVIRVGHTRIVFHHAARDHAPYERSARERR